MFLYHTELGLGLIALALGTTLLIWSMRNEGLGTSIARIVGGGVMTVSLVVMLCSGYYSLKFWWAGQYSHGMGHKFWMDRMQKQGTPQGESPKSE